MLCGWSSHVLSTLQNDASQVVSRRWLAEVGVHAAGDARIGVAFHGVLSRERRKERVNTRFHLPPVSAFGVLYGPL
jgi:hypothetical protein